MIDRLQESTRIIELFKQRESGVLTILSEVKNGFQGPELDFVGSDAAATSRALYSQETRKFGEYTSLIVGLATQQQTGENNGR